MYAVTLAALLLQAMVKTELLKALKEEETKAVLHKVGALLADDAQCMFLLQAPALVSWWCLAGCC